MPELSVDNSIRSQVLNALENQCTDLLVLLPGGPPSTPAIYWARQVLAPSELPAVVITPQPETSERLYGVDQISMPVQVSLICLLGDRIPVDIGEDLLAGLRKTVPKDPTLGGKSIDIRYTEGGITEYPQDSDQALVVSSLWEILYETATNDPFTQP